jgi:hypothetical protein
MDQTRFRIDSNVRFHPEMPLLAFARRAHLRIAFPPLILGRARRGDDRRIDDRALPARAICARLTSPRLRKRVFWLGKC